MTSLDAISVNDLTLTEKAALTGGADVWRTKPIERLGLPAIMLSDGPHGLRKQAVGGDHLGLGESVPATCFPPAVALGASFDPELVESVGRAIGAEAAAEDVAVVLGPGINIKRSPLCGRNFEYFSEDPTISGVMGAALVRGIQSRGIGASVKHFAANNQETDRMRVSADIAPRPLREIYLRGFEHVIRTAQPWTVMSSYNRINGVYASEDPWLLTQVLRDEWGFDGLVVSDWGAVDDRVAALVAGLDLEMPGSGGRTEAQVVAAVESGQLDEATLDRAVTRALDLVKKAAGRSDAGGSDATAESVDLEAHHRLAREVASRCIVLLKNDENLLPLASDARIAVIGAFAKEPRHQGAGSSRINPTRLDNALEEIRQISTREVVFAPGFTLDGTGDADALRDEATGAAAKADVAVVFLGLPAADESEGFDRTGLELPEPQVELLEAVLAANPFTVVVLSHGGVVTMPFRNRVPAILDGALLGQAGGGAIADVLYGRAEPTGRLTETVPLRIEDTAAFGNFPGEDGHVTYGEGLLVGYRWYDARRLDVAFPFGHGLSYTTFAYGQAKATAQPDGDILVRVPVTNTGTRTGREVVQVYVSLPGSPRLRAQRELKAFRSVEIAPGSTVEIELRLRRVDLAVWDTAADGWVVEGGDYLIEVGASSRDIRANATARLESHGPRAPLTRRSSLEEVLADPHAAQLIAQAVEELADQMPGIEGILQDEEMMTLMASFPVGRLPGYGGLPITDEFIDQTLAAVNGARGADR